MSHTTRRTFVLTAATAAAALGLGRPLGFVDAALAQAAPAAGKGFSHFKVGDIAMTTLYDGVAQRPNAAGFVRNASVADVKAALTAANLSDATIPNPFVVPAARVGGKTILFDAGTGGQLAPSAGLLADNMTAAGFDPAGIDMVLVSHFHPDHIFGLMAKETNAPVFAKAEIVLPEAEYAWWTDAANTGKLPADRQGLVKRIGAVFPEWKKAGRIRLVGANVEVAPGIRSVAAPGHTAGHTAWHVASGRKQLFVLADTVTFNPVFLRNPHWHAAFDGDGALAESSRRALIGRAIAENAMVTAYHFVFPGAGRIAKDGASFTFAPIG